MSVPHLDLRDQFQPIAQEFRRRRRLILFIGIPALMGLFALGMAGSETRSRSGQVHPATINLPFSPALLFGGFALGVMAVLLASLTWGNILKCPRCQVNLDTTQKFNFCPVCGEDRVEKRMLLMGSVCRACNTNLYRGRHRRSYRIRYCPGCSVLLDEAGIR